MEITLTPRRLTRCFAWMVSVLLAAHLIVQTVRFATGDHSLFGLVVLFSVGADGNLPTYYSAAALLFCAGLLAWIGLATRGSEQAGERFIHPYYWFGLALVFTYLSIDEMLALHEHLIEPIRSKFGTTGLFYYAWIIPYGVLLLCFLAVYSRFLVRLPKPHRTRFILSGAVFVAGALGLEMIGGRHSELYGNKNITYVALQTLEEGCEMVGIVMFIHALSSYLQEQAPELRVRLDGSKT